MSKLPIPNSSRTLNSQNSNFVKTAIRSHEAPPSSMDLNPMTRAPMLRRRSKSVADLNSLRNKPVNFNTFKAGLLKSSTTCKQSQAVQKKIVSRDLIGTNLRNKVVQGTKRPAPPNKTADNVGESKPKLAKKLPEWDYKGRFLQLKEKYQEQQEILKILRIKETQYDYVQANCMELEQALKEKENENKILQEKCAGFDQLKRLNSELEKKYEETHVELQTVLQKNKELKEKLNEIQDRLNKITKQFETADKERTDLTKALAFYKEQMLKFELERKILHNTIQDLKGNIRVFCRVRPQLSSELDKIPCRFEFPEDNCLSIGKNRESVNQITGKPTESKTEFLFDRVFSQEAKQNEIFEELSQLVQSALDGYNVCVLAYGQTGSGKTFTMQGTEGERGMIPQTNAMIFEKIALLETLGWTYNVEASFIEIYNENVRDLLNRDNNLKLEIHFNEGRGTTVSNLMKVAVKSPTELEKFMIQASGIRATAATDFNEHSSRSHFVTKIYIEGRNNQKELTYIGSINLVDLAGSESAKQSVQGDRLKETRNINKSLATLGDVIGALHNKAKHVPYRNSKLTYLLQSSLGGNSKTLMIVNVSPLEECFAESVNALRFASKVKEVKMVSKRTKMPLTSISLN
ncbi:hypothetical protein ABEB36_008257 [Hypothenemus hampei]|uniref:Kinesin-like protein n=1 Tax=Hypothenemus hampei TaxID=57062 RepID=A0ABD1ENG2_HYPHA